MQGNIESRETLNAGKQKKLGKARNSESRGTVKAEKQ